MKKICLVLAILLFVFQESAILAAMPNLKLPFSCGETWSITCGYGGSGYHQGKDFYAIDFNRSDDLNKPVLTIADGNVIFSGWIDGYGWTVDIDHGNGYISRYPHFTEQSNISGHVAQGQQIGKCGMSGGTSTGSHIHLAFYKVVDGVQTACKPEPMSGILLTAIPTPPTTTSPPQPASHSPATHPKAGHPETTPQFQNRPKAM